MCQVLRVGCHLATQSLFLYDHIDETERLVVCVHGTGRNEKEHGDRCVSQPHGLGRDPAGGRAKVNEDQ